MHLFDASNSYIDKLTFESDQRFALGDESQRLLEDRMMVLEQDHRRLNKVVEEKVAVDSEQKDFELNERNEDVVMLEVRDQLPSNLTSKEWQDRSRELASRYFKELMGPSFNFMIDHVRNATGRRKDAPTRLQVKLTSAEAAREIRSKFGFFFSGGVDVRPPYFKDVSIRNWITPETKVRLAILQILAKRYRSSYEGSKAQAVGFRSRPVLRITPPSTASDRRSRTYSFIEAIKKFPTNFSKAELEIIMAKVNSSMRGRLRAVFVVLSDDNSPPQQRTADASQTRPSASSTPAEPDPDAIVPADAADDVVVTHAEVYPPARQGQGTKRRPSPIRNGTRDKSSRH